MTFQYFRDADTLYIELSGKPVADSNEVAPGIVVNLDAEGKIIGIALDGASKKIDTSGFPEDDPEPTNLFDYTTLPTEVRLLLENPSEGLRQDFKSGFSWKTASTSAKMELAKDLVAFANSGGGRLVIGVADGSFQIDGSLPSDHGFDQTAVGDSVNRWFQPPVSFTVNSYPVSSEPKIVVISVQEFEFEPHVCSGGSHPLCQGAFYVRTTDGKSKPVSTVSEMRHILRIAARKLRQESIEIVSDNGTGGHSSASKELFTQEELDEFVTASKRAIAR